MTFVDAARETGQVHFGSRVHEKRDGIPAGMHQFLRGIDHPVYRGFQLLVGQTLQHIADVHHQLLRKRGDRNPLSVLSQDLQAIRTGAHKQRDQVDVAMLSCSYRVCGDFIGFFDREIMDLPQDGVAVSNLVFKIILRKIQV